MGRDLLLLLRTKLRKIRNGWTQRGEGSSWRRQLAPLWVLIWLGLLGSASLSGFRSLQGMLGAGAEIVALEAMAGAFLGGMLLALVNGMRQIFELFFLSGDLPLLLSTPLSRRAIFVDRFLEGMVDNGGYATMMVLPPGVAFLYAFGAPWVAYLWLVIAFLLLLAGLTALSILFDLLIIRLVSASRARQVLISLNMLLILGIIILYNVVNVRVISPDWIVGRLAAGLLSRQASYLPTTWMARSLAALLPSLSLSFWEPALLLIGLAGGLTGVAIWASGHLYGRGWGAAQETARRRQRRSATPSTRGGSPLRAFLTKDLRYFLRETRSWGMLLFGLVFLGFFGLSFAQDITNASSMTWMWTALALPGMASLFTTRWLLSAFNQEGAAWWVIQASPLREEEIWGAKFILNYVLSLLYATVGVLLLFALSPLPPLWLGVAMGLTILLVAGTTGIGLAVAAWRTDMAGGSVRRRDMVGSYSLMGMLALYVGLPAVLLVLLEELMGLATSLPPAMVVLLATGAYLPVTVLVWAGMRAWALHSLRRLRMER